MGLRWSSLAIVDLRWPSLACVGLRWPLLARVGHRRPALAIHNISSVKYIKENENIPGARDVTSQAPPAEPAAGVDLRWPSLAIVGLRWLFGGWYKRVVAVGARV